MQLSSVHPDKRIHLNWLLEATESRQPLNETSPIWVRHGSVLEGPPAPHPETHPYCEIGIIFVAEEISMVEGEEAPRHPGDVLLLGPGIPHFARILNYPLHFTTVYFLPSVLIEMGPLSDGVRALRRFTSKQPLEKRLIRPTPKLLSKLRASFKQMAVEFDQQYVGREMRLRALLSELLISILRWEKSQGLEFQSLDLEADWRPIMKVFAYLRSHYTEPVYSRDVARMAGLSRNRLNILFKEAIGISWLKFLQGYRIHRAAALLTQPGCNVTEAALAVGFESLSHFHTTFQAYMGVTPQNYSKNADRASVKNRERELIVRRRRIR